MNAFRVAVLLFLSAVAASLADGTNTLPTTITVDGIIYSNVTWRTVTPATVSIYHQTGVMSLQLQDLPAELQQRFGYDPKRAADYIASEAVRAAIAARAEAERAATKAAREKAESEKTQVQQQPGPSKTISPPEAYFDIRFTDVSDFTELDHGWYSAKLYDPDQGVYTIAVFPEAGLAYISRYLKNSRMERTDTTTLDGAPIYQNTTETITHKGIVYARRLSPDEVAAHGLNELHDVALLVGSTTYRPMGGPVSYTW